MPGAPYELTRLRDRGTSSPELQVPGAERGPGRGVLGAAFGQRAADPWGEALAGHRSTRHTPGQVKVLVCTLWLSAQRPPCSDLPGVTSWVQKLGCEAVCWQKSDPP